MRGTCQGRRGVPSLSGRNSTMMGSRFGKVMRKMKKRHHKTFETTQGKLTAHRVMDSRGFMRHYFNCLQGLLHLYLCRFAVLQQGISRTVAASSWLSSACLHWADSSASDSHRYTINGHSSAVLGYSTPLAHQSSSAGRFSRRILLDIQSDR